MMTKEEMEAIVSMNPLEYTRWLRGTQVVLRGASAARSDVPRTVAQAHAAQRDATAPPQPWSLAIAKLRAAGTLPPAATRLDEDGVPQPWATALRRREPRGR